MPWTGLEVYTCLAVDRSNDFQQDYGHLVVESSIRQSVFRLLIGCIPFQWIKTAHTLCRVLTIEGIKNVVKVGGMRTQGKGTIEKLLGSHSKEFGLISSTVGVEKSCMPLLGETAQAQ